MAHNENDFRGVSAEDAARYIRTTLNELINIAERAGYDEVTSHLRRALGHADREAKPAAVSSLSPKSGDAPG